MAPQLPSRPPDLEAVVSFTPTHEGGRQRPVYSGYRPNHDFGLSNELNDAQHHYPDDECVQPGQAARTLLWLLVPERQVGRLHLGFKFTVQEGSRIIGHGTVTSVINEALESPVPDDDLPKPPLAIPPECTAAHKHSSWHRAELGASTLCGCFHCCATFPPDAIVAWVDADEQGIGQTAICPECGIASVLGDNSGFPVTWPFLATMRAHWS